MKHKEVWQLLVLAPSLMLWGGCEASSSSPSGPGAAESATMIQPSKAPPQSPRNYSKDLEDLRASFNREKGKVRLVTLLSPT